MTGPRPLHLLAFCGATAWGGAEIVLGHLLAALDERIDVDLLGVDPAVVERLAARRPGTGWDTVPPIRDDRDLGRIWVHRQAMARISPDIVQLNLPVPFADPYTVLSAATLPRVPVIGVAHLPMPMPGPRIARLVRATASHLAAVVGVSSGAAREVEQLLGLGEGTVRVVHNGVPEPEERRAVPAPPGRVVVGAVGRLHEQKGFDVLLRAVAGLPEVHVVVVGDGQERAGLERLAADLGLHGRVSWLGWSDHASGYVRSFDVLAVPSRYEGLPLVVLEAMLGRVPLVVTPVGGIPDAVRDGESGLVVPVDDVAALRSALARLAADPGLGHRLAAAAEVEARRRFTAEAMARSYEALYDEVLARRRFSRRSARSRPRRWR
ncbi:glycosyltransferase [Geodermatophilus maliterrae]|uniref:Glycosyltransferase n=1 Tax=Geodermatophilus maliterrae TaxID=3162531 RepID=A0ABV3XLD4_9ACTN